MTQHHLRSRGGGRTEGGELEAGRGVRTAGGNCGTERREELNAKMLHNSSLVFPTGGIIIQEKHTTTIQYHALTGSSKTPPPAHIPSHNLEASFFFLIYLFKSYTYKVIRFYFSYQHCLTFKLCTLSDRTARSSCTSRLYYVPFPVMIHDVV